MVPYYENVKIIRIYFQGGLKRASQPGPGQSVLKNHLAVHQLKNWITPRPSTAPLPTWHNILRLLCHAFELENDGNDHRREVRLVPEARPQPKSLLTYPVLEPHPLPVLIGHPELNTTLQLRINRPV